MTVTRRLLVSGRVQRVGFRAFVAGTARREGVRGFVRNLADGRVEAVGEGDREAMDRFERALQQGPRLSKVLGVTVEDVAPLDATRGFVVRNWTAPRPDTMQELKSLIRDVPDFPKPGILFKDITTLVGDPGGLRRAIGCLTDPFREAGIDKVVGIESRGFIFGAAVAERLGAGFVPARKPGKLPARTVRVEYALEYGVDGLELHEDGLAADQRVLIVDDLLATGGTARAAADLVTGRGAAVHALAFLVELDALRGRDRLAGHEVFAALHY